MCARNHGEVHWDVQQDFAITKQVEFECRLQRRNNTAKQL